MIFILQSYIPSLAAYLLNLELGSVLNAWVFLYKNDHRFMVSCSWCAYIFVASSTYQVYVNLKSLVHADILGAKCQQLENGLVRHPHPALLIAYSAVSAIHSIKRYSFRCWIKLKFSYIR
jgi:hypothetical protein